MWTSPFRIFGRGFFNVMKAILYRPQIPQNTGNIVRTCKVTQTELVLVKPLGFKIDDKSLKRAGLDYWNGAKVSITKSLEDYLETTKFPFYFFSSHAKKIYSEVEYTRETLLIFGSEGAGLPSHFWKKWKTHFVTIPMHKKNHLYKKNRCINLSTAVGIALYEALRQQEFKFC